MRELKSLTPLFLIALLICGFSLANITQFSLAQSNSLTAASSDSNSWPMFHNNLAHSGYTEFAGPLTDQVLWKYPAGSGIESSPAVVDYGVVYFGVLSNGQNGFVSAVDASTGAKIWQFATDSDVESSPAVVNGVVYIGSYSGKVYALDAKSGSRKWTFDADDSVFSSPAVVGGKVYFGSASGDMWAVLAAEGLPSWKAHIGGAILSSPAVVDGVVYVGSQDQYIYAMGTDYGEIIWRHATGSFVDASPAVVDGVVYFGTRDGNVYALNAANGAELWSFHALHGNGESSCYSTPAVANGVVYVGSYDSSVYALNATTGSMIWDFPTGGYIFSSPVVAGATVYVGSCDGNVYALNALTGSKIWSYQTGDQIRSSAAVANGVVYVGSDDGYLYAFGDSSSTPTRAHVPPGLDWQKTFNGTEATWLAQVDDGGYVFLFPGLYISSYGGILESATLTKVDTRGNIQWTQNLGGPPFPENFIVTIDGGYAYTLLNDGVLTLQKLNSNAAGQWNKTITADVDGSTLLVQTDDDGFAVTVHSFRGYVNDVKVVDLTLFKLDAEGNVQWTKTFDMLNSTYGFRSLIQTEDGGYALVGSYRDPFINEPSSPFSNGSDFSLVKINSEGDLHWTKTYGGVYDDEAYSFVQTEDGGYTLVGNTRSFGAGETDAFMVKTDVSGNLEWAQTYGGCGWETSLPERRFFSSDGTVDDYAYSLVQTIDGGFAFAGATEYHFINGQNSLAWLVKTDANGFVQWNGTYSDTEVGVPSYPGGHVGWGVNALIQARDGSFVMAGYAAGSTGHWWDQASFIVKTEPATALPTTSSPPNPMSSLEFPSITINPDGSITPSNAPITRDGNEYKLTQDAHSLLVVKTDNVTINGQGHLLIGNGTIGNLFVLKSNIAISLFNVKNITIRDLCVQNFKAGILFDNASDITLLGNNLASNNQGILGIESENAIISENDFGGRYQEGVHLTSCLNSEIMENKLIGSGVTLDHSNGTIISGNNFDRADVVLHSSENALITANMFYATQTSFFDSNGLVAANDYVNCEVPIGVLGVCEVTFYMNNFIENAYLPKTGLSNDSSIPFPTQINLWDNGTVGNYWSNYTQQYPNAQQKGDGTWDTPYFVSENNTDLHPLVAPVSSEEAFALSQSLISTHIPSTASSPTTSSGDGTEPPLGTPLLTFAVVAVVSAIVIGVGLLVYFKRRRRDV